MKLHIPGIRDNIAHYLNNEYTPPIAPMTMKQMIKKRNHNIMMIEITSTLNNVKFDDIKNCTNTK